MAEPVVLAAIAPAWRRMVELLFRPVRWRFWVKMAVLTLLLGGANYNGSCNIPGGDFSELTRDHATGRDDEGVDVRETAGGALQLRRPAATFVRWVNWLAAWSRGHVALLAAGGVLLAAAALVLLVAAMYLQARVQFMFLHGLVTGHCRWRAAWREFPAEAWSLWRWQLGALAVALLAVLVTGGGVALVFWLLDRALSRVVLAAVLITLGVLVIMVLAVAGVAWQFAVNNLIIPGMYAGRRCFSAVLRDVWTGVAG
ncbi:MAG TPA: hypothetical protein PKM88_07850, partial [bacterium]|nr:hypothetical protein [bacterium]